VPTAFEVIAADNWRPGEGTPTGSRPTGRSTGTLCLRAPSPLCRNASALISSRTACCRRTFRHELVILPPITRWGRSASAPRMGGSNRGCRRTARTSFSRSRHQRNAAVRWWRKAAACPHGRLRPDGYGVFRLGRRAYGFFLEFDRGTVRSPPLRAHATRTSARNRDIFQPAALSVAGATSWSSCTRAPPADNARGKWSTRAVPTRPRANSKKRSGSIGRPRR